MNYRSTACALLLSVFPGDALAQTSTPPPTQDAQFQSLLGLGDARGCIALLGIDPAKVFDGNPANDPTKVLLGLGSSMGNELRAICGPSAVTSASSLGGGLNTLQATKTATQFRLARRRIDQRLLPATAAPSAPTPASPPRPGGSRTPGIIFTTPAYGVFNAAAAVDDALDVRGLGLFGEARLDSRDRTGTAYESAYEASAKSFTAGLDYLNGRTLVGGWFSGTTEDGDFTKFSPLLSGSATGTFGSVLNSPNVLSQVCGGLKNGGGFDSSTKAVGAFVGHGIGSGGFFDGTAGWSRRTNNYARSVCIIEADPSNGLTYENGILKSNGGQTTIDDIFAGTILATHTVDEKNVSARLGANYGNERWLIGPRASFTLTQITTPAYFETGRSTVANDVVANDSALTTKRTLGGPIGVELAYSDQSYTSALLEGGAEVATRAGKLVPFASGYWRHEFLDGYRLVRARFVQDRRSTPTTFTFGNDRPDADALMLGFGAAIPLGPRGFVRVEANTLMFDRLFSLFSLSAQARVQF